MLIAVPSKSRASLTTTNKILPSATFYVPKSEIHQYQSLIKNVVAVPNDIKGITPTRNWILKHTKEKYVVFNEFHVPLGYSCKHCFSIYLDNDVLIMIGNEDNIDVFGEA